VQSLFDPRVIPLLVEEREARLRRTNLLTDEEPAHRPLRRWVGRRLVRWGERLAGEPTMRPVRAR
jgi:hypothetical protein